MCDAAVLQAVKASAQKQGRGAFVSRGGARSVQPARQPLSGAIVRAESVVDLTHELHEDFPTYIGQRQFSRRKQVRFDQGGINIDTLTMSEHLGTHIDAPLHFSSDGQSVDEIPLGDLIAPLCVIDIRAKAEANPDAELTLDDLRAWTRQHGALPPDACVAMLSGWSRFVTTPQFRNVDREGKMHFPGIHPDVAAYLEAETRTVGLAVDTLSLDTGASTDFPTHRAWLPAGGWGLECLAHLECVPASGATIVVGAPKHRGGTGGPARVLALI